MNVPSDFPDSSIKFRNIAGVANEKEVATASSPIAKLIVIDYFDEVIKRLNLKNPIIVSGDMPTYSTFSYTATEGDRIAPKYSRGVSVIVSDWSIYYRALGDVLAGDYFTYLNRINNDPNRVLEENTYGWVENIDLEITYWTINSSKGRDVGGQFIKRTMLEGLKTLHFLKNGIISVQPQSGFDSNDSNILKNNNSVLYQHVTRWSITGFFFINMTIYEEASLIQNIDLDFESFGTSESYTNYFAQESNGIISTNNLQADMLRQDENLNTYTAVTLAKTAQPSTTSTTTSTTYPGQYVDAPIPENLNNYYLQEDTFKKLLDRDMSNSAESIGIIRPDIGQGVVYLAQTTTTTSSTTTTTI